MTFFPAGTYDLFLTHAWHYNDEWQGMVAMLDGHMPGKWRNWSLPWHDTSIERHTPDGKAALEKLLEGHIAMASAILILPETLNMPDGRMWLDKELEIAARHSKPTIGILPEKSSAWELFRKTSPFPKEISRGVNELVTRNAAEIIKAVDRLSSKASV